MKSLIIAPAWIGDMVMAHTLVQLLERAHPGIEIHMVAPSATAPLVGRMPGVAAVHELCVGHGQLGWRARRRLAAALRECGFQTAYVLPNSFKSALIPFWAKIPKRVGWHGESRYWLLNDRRRLDTKRHPRMIDRFIGLGLPRQSALRQSAGGSAQESPREEPSHNSASAPPKPAAVQQNSKSVPQNSASLRQSPAPTQQNSPTAQQNSARVRPAVSGLVARCGDSGRDQLDEASEPDGSMPMPRLLVSQENRARALTRLGLRRNRPITVLCPGAEYGGAKRWPPEHFAAVARATLEQGHSVWLLGTTADAESAHRIAHAAPGVENLAGRTSLLDALDLLSLAELVITNDSGLMHVACALNRNVVAIFGSTSPAFTPPLSPLAVVVENDLDCRPCFQRECPLEHLNCLRGIAPERILSAQAMG